MDVSAGGNGGVDGSIAGARGTGGASAGGGGGGVDGSTCCALADRAYGNNRRTKTTGVRNLMFSIDWCVLRQNRIHFAIIDVAQVLAAARFIVPCDGPLTKSRKSPE